MTRQYVVIVDHSAGNETVGNMWKETKVFDGNVTLEKVMKWAMKEVYMSNGHPFSKYSTQNITLTLAHPGDEDDTV